MVQGRVRSSARCTLRSVVLITNVVFDFVSFWAPGWSSFGLQHRCQIESKVRQKLSWGNMPPQDRPKKPQERPKTPQDLPRTSSRRSKTARRPLQEATDRHMTPQDRPKMLHNHPKTTCGAVVGSHGYLDQQHRLSYFRTRALRSGGIRAVKFASKGQVCMSGRAECTQPLWALQTAKFATQGLSTALCSNT